MKSILSIFACAALLILAAGAQAQMPRQTQLTRPVQTFDTSAGPVKITPVYHASLEIEAGGKVIIIDPAKPANFARKFDGVYGRVFSIPTCRLFPAESPFQGERP